METQVGCVDESTQNEVREVSDKVIKGHPGQKVINVFIVCS